MDPESLLDSALFQLTPTRTRCDLVVVCGGKSEKIASGLVEPFLCHLKFAKDQIPKGGYSITLCPPKSDAFWFTKATFQRFVRFVSTPEVLERFARLEKEILQIESSVQPNELANGNVAGQAEEGGLSTANGITKPSTNSSKLKGEIDGTDDVVQEENSKIRLQRLLETRKALLRKEQAMAYARALAAGFELDNVDDLISFADAFGASRLREACTDFKELCKKKLTDGLWMDEVAAMQACSQTDLSFLGNSGIILACDNGLSAGTLVSNGSLDVSSESVPSQINLDSNKDNSMPASDQLPVNSAKVQVQMPWPNQIPPYMFNFQGPVQQMPQYQAYPFPGMPPYFQGNMQWAQNMDASIQNQRSSSRKKEKSRNAGPETSEEDEQTESGDSDTGTDSEATAIDDKRLSSTEQLDKKKGRNKSSKTVFIRNINYITSKKRTEEKDRVSCESSVEDELVDEDFLKQKVEDVVGSLEKHHKTSSNNQKRSGSKSPSFVNGANGFSDQELENNRVNNTSEGAKGNQNWDAFQNLLMSEKEPTPNAVLDEQFTMKTSIDSVSSNANAVSVNFDSEKVQTRRKFGTDSFVVTERNEANEGRVNYDDFGSGETPRPSMKRRDYAEEALLFPHRLEESRSISQGMLSDFGKDSSIIKNGSGEDCFIINRSIKSESREVMFYGGYALPSEGDRPQTEVSKKVVPIDDSFMVQSQKSIDDQYDSHWKTDVSLVSDLIGAHQPENGTPDASQNKSMVSVGYEPDDLSVVLTRDSGFESVGVSWSPELDYGVEASFTEADKIPPVVETNDQIEEKSPVKSKSTNNTTKQLKPKGLQGSIAKSKSNVLTKSKKPIPSNRPMIQKSKLEKEEEARKRMEELVIQRQKRIAERTAVSGSPAASKKAPVGSKLASPRHDKLRPQSTPQKSPQIKQIGSIKV
ncbi:disease resistance protein [Actinidia rufa]|uniref:Disease resistance protein n=1 Tax=Actinidia rufa TaxID=165716 RepID=A0A7J0FWY5_9ERIC|nr:disease resistance protein [Actinidia rufa]